MTTSVLAWLVDNQLFDLVEVKSLMNQKIDTAIKLISVLLLGTVTTKYQQLIKHFKQTEPIASIRVAKKHVVMLTVYRL